MAGPVHRIEAADLSGILAAVERLGARMDALDPPAQPPHKRAPWLVTVAALIGSALAGYQTRAQTGAKDEHATAVEQLAERVAETEHQLERIEGALEELASRPAVPPPPAPEVDAPRRKKDR